MSESITRSFVIQNALGLHARAATKLAQLSSKYPCEVEVAREGEAANAKSVMGLLLLCGSQGTTIDVTVTGERGEDCLAAIEALINDKFGEGK
jgi:phosphocarrier protein